MHSAMTAQLISAQAGVERGSRLHAAAAALPLLPPVSAAHCERTSDVPATFTCRQNKTDIKCSRIR